MVLGCRTSPVFLLVVLAGSLFCGPVAFRAFQESPRVERAVRPAYPAIAAAKRVSGKVLIRVEINCDGTVRKATIKSGPSLLRKAAKDAAIRWRFNVVEDASNVRRKAQLVFIFHPVSYTPKEGEPDFKPPYEMSVRWEGISGAE